MNTFSTVTSSIIRLNLTGSYFVGTERLDNVTKVRYINGRLGSRKLEITISNGDTYTVSQFDRGFFEVNGPHLTHCDVKGWNDAARLINSL